MPERRDRAVSHVVGIALLVAIVTILAATMAVYVGTFGDAAAGESVPNAVLRTAMDDRASPNGQYVNITHKGGETVETANLRLDIDGATASPSGSVELESGQIAAQIGPEWTATETLEIDQRVFTDGSGNQLETEPESVVLEDATIRIIFERSETETTILYECEVGSPDCTNREA